MKICCYLHIIILSLAVVESVQVQDKVPFKNLEQPEKEKSSVLGDPLPDQGHVVQDDPEPFIIEEISVEEEPASSDLVQEDGSFKEDSLGKPDPYDKEEEAVAYKALQEIEPVSESRYKRPVCTGIIIDGKCYQFFRGPLAAYDAEFYCQKHFPNGHLASVTSSGVHRHMMMLMDRNGGRTRTWIGGLRYLHTGRFIWLDGEQWNYADWLPGEPNNTANVENCVELLSNSKFNDMPCWDLRAYICSYRL